jgi:hypothetical protein
MKKNLLLVVISLISMLFFSIEANAALPAVVGTTLTGIQTDASSMFDLLFPVVGAVMGFFIILKLFKRGANKI